MYWQWAIYSSSLSVKRSFVPRSSKISLGSSPGIFVEVPFLYWSARSSQKWTSFNISWTHRQCSNTKTYSRVVSCKGWIPLSTADYSVDAVYYDGCPSELRDSRALVSKSKKMGLGTILTQWVRIKRNLRRKIGVCSGLFHLFVFMNCSTKLTSSRFSSFTLNSFCTLPMMPTRLSRASST